MICLFSWGIDGSKMEHPSPVCPRQLLKKILNEANKQGYSPVFSQEFEWFNFAETPQSMQ